MASAAKHLPNCSQFWSLNCCQQSAYHACSCSPVGGGGATTVGAAGCSSGAGGGAAVGMSAGVAATAGASVLDDSWVGGTSEPGVELWLHPMTAATSTAARMLLVTLTSSD